MNTIRAIFSARDRSVAWVYVFILSVLGVILGIFLGSFSDTLLNIDTQLIGAVIGASVGGGFQHRYSLPHLLRCIATILGVTSGLLFMIGMPPTRIHPMVFLSIVSMAVVGVTVVRLLDEIASRYIVQKNV